MNPIKEIKEEQSQLYGALDFIDIALDNFREVGDKLSFPSEFTTKTKIVAFQKNHNNKKTFYNGLKATEEALTNTKIYGTQLKTLAKRLQSDLVDIRGQQGEDSLCMQEKTIFRYMSKFNVNTQSLVEHVQDLVNTDLTRIKELGCFEPKDHEYAGKVYENLMEVNSGLNKLKSRTEALLNLENKVDKLTEIYVNL